MERNVSGRFDARVLLKMLLSDLATHAYSSFVKIPADSSQCERHIWAWLTSLFTTIGIQMRVIFSSMLLLSLCCIFGCSGGTGPSPVASQDELENFLEANPELNVPDNDHEEEDDEDDE